MTPMQALIEMSRRMADQLEKIQADQDTLIGRLPAVTMQGEEVPAFQEPAR